MRERERDGVLFHRNRNMIGYEWQLKTQQNEEETKEHDLRRNGSF